MVRRTPSGLPCAILDFGLVWLGREEARPECQEHIGAGACPGLGLTCSGLQWFSPGGAVLGLADLHWHPQL